MSTPFEDLTKANWDYHEAVNEIFQDNTFIDNIELRAEVKAKFGAFHNDIFQLMKEASDLIAEYYVV